MGEKLKYFGVFNKNAKSFSWWECREIARILKGSENLEGILVVTNSPDDLERALRDYQDYHPNIFGLGGGDGTFKETLTLLEKVWGRIPPMIAPFANGTINNWALLFHLSAGVYDKIRKLTRRPTKAIELADYITQNTPELKTEELDVLDVNGVKGCNIGFGVIPKLLWAYYGKTIEQFQKLEQRLQEAEPPEFEKVLKEICAEPNLIEMVSNGNLELLKKTGAAYAFWTALISIAAAMNPFSERMRFYHQPFEGEIFIDGEKIDSAEVNTLYLSTEPHFGLGFDWATLYPAPRARSERGKMEVGLSRKTGLGIVRQLPKLIRGEPLEGVEYHLAGEVVLKSSKPIIGQVEGDFVIAREFTIKYDQTINIIAPYGHLEPPASLWHAARRIL